MASQPVVALLPTAGLSAPSTLTSAPIVGPLPLGSPVPQSIFTSELSTQAWQAHMNKLDPKDRDFFLKHATGSVQSYSKLVQEKCTLHQEQSHVSKINRVLRPFCKTLGLYMPVAAAASQADPYPSSLVIGGLVGLLQISENFDSFEQQILVWLSKLSAKVDLLEEFDVCIYQYDQKIQDLLVLIYGDILDFCQKALRLYVREDGERRRKGAVVLKSLIGRFEDSFGDIVTRFEMHMELYKERANRCDSKLLMRTFWTVCRSGIQRFENHREVMSALAAVTDEVSNKQLNIYQMHLSTTRELLEDNHKTREGILDSVANVGSRIRDGQSQAYQAQVSGFQDLHEDNRQTRGAVFDFMMAGKSQAQAQADQRAEEEVLARRRRELEIAALKKISTLMWLPSVDPLLLHNKKTTSVAAGSGDWFQKDRLYEAWTTSTHSDLLWVKGRPGSGKSVLATMVWEHLETKKNNFIATAHFYCDSEDAKASDYSCLLNTILKQLSLQQAGLHRDLEQAYDQGRLIQDRGPTAPQVEKLLPALLSDFEHAFILIDGLDELQATASFLGFLPTLLRESKCLLRIIIFCRDYVVDDLPTQHALRAYPKLLVNENTNKDDIEAFIDGKFSGDSGWEPGVLDVVKIVLRERAEGMFLYVNQTAGRLRASLPQAELFKRIGSLPKGLSKAYEANLKRILDLEDEDDKELTSKILLWIVNANRTLSRKELVEALCIREGADIKDQGGTDQDFTTLCAELVYYDQDDYYHLVHSSLRNYLRAPSKDDNKELEPYRTMQIHAERILAEACLTYLLFQDFASGPTETAQNLRNVLKINPFLRYAAKYWGSHVANAGQDAPTELVWRFIDHDKARNLSMQVIMAEDDEFAGFSSRLHTLSYFGLSEFVEGRPELQSAQDEFDGFGLLPMDYALMNSNKKMCLWLLEQMIKSGSRRDPTRGRYSLSHAAIALEWDEVLDRLIANNYNMNLTSRKGRTPIAEAAALANRSAVHILLKAKVDLETRDEEGKNPLLLALQREHLDVASSILEEDVDIDAQDNEGMSALHYAVDSLNLDIVSKVLQKKPRMQKTAKKYSEQSPIHLAAEHDKADILQELHKHGSALETPCMSGYRPMHIAAFNNSLKVARTLKGLGADANPTSEANKTVLMVAAEYSDADFLKLILESEPNVNDADEEVEDTALHAAAAAGKTTNCRLLLEKGATVNKPNVGGHTALHLAVNNGHIEATKLLLDSSFSPMMTAVFNSPVLHYAAHRGDERFVSLLIDAHADPEAGNLQKHRAIHFAAREDHVKFVEQLFVTVPQLNVNAQDEDGKTALHLAAAAGYLETVRLLLDKAAERGIKDSSKNLPLHYAAWGGHLEVVELLVSDDDMDTPGFYGRTILLIGTLRGHMPIVQLLLNRKANIELPDEFKMTPLAKSVEHKHQAITAKLIDSGASLQATDVDNKTLLHLAARNGDRELVKLLLDQGLDIRASTRHKYTPFFEAVCSNDMGTIELFLERGIDLRGLDRPLDTSIHGTTSFHAAAEQGNLNVLIKLLNSGVTSDAIDCEGKNALSLAATNGRHEIVEALLGLRFDVDGPENCDWPTLCIACDDGYPIIVDMLLEHDADMQRPIKPSGMSPLHCAASMHRPAIIRSLVEQGADVFSRDLYANSALDYAYSHSESWQAIKPADLKYLPLNVGDRITILWRTIRGTLESLMSIGQLSTVEKEKDRVMTIGVIANCLHYLGERHNDRTIQYLYLELCHYPDSANLRYNLDCAVCNSPLHRSNFSVCRECHDIRICEKCHEKYEKGWKTTRSPPESVKEMERLEKEIEPLRKAMLPIIDKIVPRWVVFAFSFFDSVENWADAKRNEYESWESKFNDNDQYRFKKRPSQELLKLLEQGRVLAKDLEGDGRCIDEEGEDWQRYCAKLSGYHREHNVFRDDPGFHCQGHEYIHILEKDFKEAREDANTFSSEGRLTQEWLGGLLAKCPPIEGTAPQPMDEKPLRGSTTSLAETATIKVDGGQGERTQHDSEAVKSTSMEPAEKSEEQSSGSNPTKPTGKAERDVDTPTGAPAPVSRPKMPQGLRSSFARSASWAVSSTAADFALSTGIEPVAAETTLPVDAASSSPTLQAKGKYGGPDQITNTLTSATQLLHVSQRLKRSVTSPRLDFGDPFEQTSIVRSATTPIPWQAFPGRAIAFNYKATRQQEQQIARHAETGEASVSLSGEASLTEEQADLTAKGLTSPSISDDSKKEKEVMLSVSSTSNLGRIVMLAVGIAESVIPGFRDTFFNARVTTQDWARYGLKLEAPNIGGESSAVSDSKDDNGSGAPDER